MRKNLSKFKKIYLKREMWENKIKIVKYNIFMSLNNSIEV